MSRNLDMTALRSFVAVAEAGGVTRAAGFLNLTQSAVSMQLKRLEDSLGLNLLDRSGRTVALTASGEQLLGYAKRMLVLNDEVFARMTHQCFEGEIVLGVPSDIVYPMIPQVLRRFAQDYPRMRVQLISSYTRRLKAMFDRGECDIILTTEDVIGTNGETLVELPLVWAGAPNGIAWRQKPLPLAFCRHCIFRSGAQLALDKAGIAWSLAVDSDSSRSVEASVAADLALSVWAEGAEPHFLARVPHGGALPDLGRTKINLYVADPAHGPIVALFAGQIRQAFCGNRGVTGFAAVAAS